MTKRLHFKNNQAVRSFLPIFLLLLGLWYPKLSFAESYTLSVGENVTISQTAYNGGYIDNVGLADYLDPHLGFTKNYDGSATITVNSYFDYTATIKLVFIERYQSYYNGRNHTLAYTYYKDVSIKCRYQAPDPSKKPTKVILPERIRVNVYSGGDRDYITPILEPNGAKGTTYYWGNDQGTAVFAARTMTDGRCWVTGRSPGIGRVYVVVDDDWDKLYASAVLEVVDPNHLPPNSVFLPSEIEISVNGSSTLTPTLVPENTSTAFTWKSEDESIATVSYGKVTGKKVGTTTIKVTTTNQLTATCTVKVVSRNGKDDEESGENNTGGSVGGHDYVDLGLSVKWATCNVGANSPEGFGSYYAWGEATEKTSYTWSTYKHCGGSILNIYDIGSDIKGTSYDAAYVNWGSDWRMPTEIEMGELVSKCTFKEETQNGVDGYLVTGPNGSSLFFPTAGVMKDKKEGGCRYWTSTVHSGDYGMSLLISKNSNNVISPSVTSQMRSFGLPIRAVTESSVNSSTIEPTSISLPASKAVKVGESFTMTYTLTPSNATTTLTWSSDDTSIATVSSSGVVNGIKAGTTKIRVKTTNGITDYCSVIVEDNDNKGIGDGTLQNPFNAIAASNKAMELGVGETSSQSYYVKGKISSIKYSYSAQYGTATFYISDDGTTNNQFYAYGAYYLENKPWEEGNPQITVGDDVILYGKMTNYNWVLEMANKENYIYSHNGRTSISNSIEPTSISLPPSITIKVGETIILTPSIYPTGAEATISGTFGNNGTISASYDNENNQFIIRGLKEGTSFQTVTTGNGLSARCEIVVRGYNPTAIGNGTLENPFNAVGAFIYACSLPINEESEESVYIKGKVLSIKEQFDSQYGNATFYISDDGTINNSFYVYRTYYLGNRKFSEGDRPIQEGDEILIYGKVIIWSNGTRYVPETSQNSSYLVSVNGAGGYTNTYQINLSNAGYATFYDSQSAYSLPNGISAQVVTSALNGKLTYKTIADGSVSGILPKGTAVMLTNEAKRSGTFTLTAAESNTYYLGTNLLHGSDEATTTTGDGYHYKLSYGPTGTKWDNVFGWYWGANDGAPFQIKEHKAWLVVPRGNGTRAAGFSIEGDVLGIETLDELADSPLNLYFDLQGRRVSQPTKRGVYVSNGKKIILK